MSPANHRKRTAEEQTARDQEQTDAQEEMRALEQGDSVPTDPHDWPTGKAKFLTFGNEDDDAYGDGPTSMLGPAGLELHADGSPTVRGRPVGDPAPAEPEPAPEPRRRLRFGRRAKSS